MVPIWIPKNIRIEFIFESSWISSRIGGTLTGVFKFESRHDLPIMLHSDRVAAIRLHCNQITEITAIRLQKLLHSDCRDHCNQVALQSDYRNYCNQIAEITAIRLHCNQMRKITAIRLHCNQITEITAIRLQKLLQSDYRNYCNQITEITAIRLPKSLRSGCCNQVTLQSKCRNNCN